MRITNAIITSIFFLAMLLCSGCDYYIVDAQIHDVGYIKPSGSDKSKEFELCFEEKIFTPYWRRSSAGYKGGKKALREIVNATYNPNGYTNESGYVTIRFIVNCEGVPGMYVIDETGADYKKKKFKGTISGSLLEITKQLDDWEPLKIFGDTYDSYTYVTYKIENGEIEDILP